MAEGDAVADLHSLGRPQERPPLVGRDAHVQRCVDLREPVFATPKAGQLRRDHLGVVEDQRVARSQQRRQVGDDAILQCIARSHDKHPRRIARLRRPQRDALFGQVEIEKVDAHGIIFEGRSVAASPLPD